MTEVTVERKGLYRRARLARYDKERASQIQVRFHTTDCRRVSAIQHSKIGIAKRVSKRCLEYLRCEAGATHTQNENVPNAIGANLIGERC